MGATFVYVPMTVQAFVVSEDFSQRGYQIAPLIQPDYSQLRHQDGRVGHDIIGPIDSGDLTNASWNPRFMNLANNQVRTNRVGVYLSWVLPDGYRTGVVSSLSGAPTHAQNKQRMGFPRSETPGSAVDPTVPEFRPVPDRWLVFRFPQYIMADPSKNTFVHNMPLGNGEFLLAPEIYVIESNRVRNIEHADFQTSPTSEPLDIENMATAFADLSVSTQEQYATFLGSKFKLHDYVEWRAKGTSDAEYRIPLTVVETTSDLFPDYQPHNTSVFSIFDDFSTNGKSASPVDHGICSYVVCGFHADPAMNPLASSAVSTTNGEILSSMSVELSTFNPSNSQANEAGNFLALAPLHDDLGRIMCHGTLNGVWFSRKGQQVTPVPSIDMQELVRDSHPVAVGTHSMDALLAYIRVADADINGASQAADLLSALEPLVLGDDDVTSQLKSKDSGAAIGFRKSSGGSSWHFEHQPLAAASSEPNNADSRTVPGLTQLQILNEEQSKIDAARREIELLQREIWYEWWKAVTDPDYSPISTISVAKSRITYLRGLITGNFASATVSATNDLGALGISVQRSITNCFFAPVDPTVLFCGITSGRPSESSGKVAGRLYNQMFSNVDFDTSSTSVLTDLGSAFGSDEVGAVKAVVAEWARMYGGDSAMRMLGITMTPKNPTPDGRVPATYENNSSTFLGPQGWYPLFIEWEIEYYHIPWEYWTFMKGAEGLYTYEIKNGVPLATTPVAADCRVIGGRTTVSQEAAAVLQSRVHQLLEKLSEEELEDVFENPEAARQVLSAATNLEYFSSSLNGLYDHLLTLRHGIHLGAAILPGKGQIHTPNTALSEGDLAAELQLTDQDFLDIASSGADRLTPYGAGTTLAQSYKYFSPFKPLAHGQARFTKLTVVDKFGQIVRCVDLPSADGQCPSLYPCISPAMSCQTLTGANNVILPNTVVDADEGEEGLCQFFQLPPRINQPSRTLVRPLLATSSSHPRFTSEWENPIWGWIVVGFAEYSLKLYHGDGTFYGQIILLPDAEQSIFSIPGVLNTSPINPKFVPENDKRIPMLAKQLIDDQSFCASFFAMCAAAAGSTTTTPADYPDFIPAAFGRPYALVDFGCGLELSCPPLQNHSTLVTKSPEKSLFDYEFSYKLGDGDAAFDGLVGYFSCGELMKNNISKLYSDFKDASLSDGVITEIHEDSHPKFKPFFVAGDVEDRDTEVIRNLQQYSIIVDPFVPLHVYTGGILPPAPLELPKWAIADAMKKITIAVKVGPLVISRENMLPSKKVSPTQSSSTAGKVQIPVPSFRKWQFLLPSDPNVAGSEETYKTYDTAAIDVSIRDTSNKGVVVVEGWLKEV